MRSRSSRVGSHKDTWLHISFSQYEDAMLSEIMKKMQERSTAIPFQPLLFLVSKVIMHYGQRFWRIYPLNSFHTTVGSKYWSSVHQWVSVQWILILSPVILLFLPMKIMLLISNNIFLLLLVTMAQKMIPWFSWTFIKCKVNRFRLYSHPCSFTIHNPWRLCKLQAGCCQSEKDLFLI